MGLSMKIIANLTLKEHMDGDVAVDENGLQVNADIKNPDAKQWSSSKLFANEKKVMIEHQNEIYFLRITKQNKLILTK
jgi:hemin uptake protein HemP